VLGHSAKERERERERERENNLLCICPQPYSLLSFIFRLSLFVSGSTAPQCARASSFTRFLDHTQRRITFGRTALDE
jgi:hypothetical protein